MGFRINTSLKAIIICLHISCIVVVTSDSKISSYSLDKGPVFYEVYYPDTYDAYHEKRRIDRNTVLENIFQIPSQQQLTYSSKNTNKPVSNKELSIGDEKNLSEEQGKAIQEDYKSTDRLIPFHDRRWMTFDNENLQSASIEGISKFVKRAISRDLENWNALKKYLDHTGNQKQQSEKPQLIPQGIYSRESRKKKRDDSYLFQANRYELLKQPSSRDKLQKLKARDIKYRPTYVEKIDVSENTIVKKMNDDHKQAAVALTDSLRLENIFQPRPQLIKYTFFKNPRSNMEEIRKKTVNSTPCNYGDNFTCKKIIENSGKRINENIKVTSIEISELPRHKTRHHHGEWFKRDYSFHRHRSSGNSSVE